MMRHTLIFILFHAVVNQAAEPVSAAALSKRIDELVMADLVHKEVEAHAPIGDSLFLRRVSLGIIGRNPTRQEYDAFTSDSSAMKRALLIDRLLASPGYGKHQVNVWGDAFRAKSRIYGQSSGDFHGAVFLDWLQHQLDANLPYDQLTYQMLSAKGGLWAKDGAVRGFLMRDFKMPLDGLSNSMQVFLATRMSCAQCHDDPTSKWTQKDFYQLAAFWNGMQYNMEYASARMRKTYGLKDPAERSVGVTISLAISPGIDGDGIGHIRLPFDYQYDDAKPGEIVKAAVPFGPHPTLDYEPIEMVKWHANHSKILGQIKYGKRPVAPKFAPNQSRHAFAKWVSHPDNNQFAIALANRIWKQVMGMGLVEPVDDIADVDDASNPPLLLALADVIRIHEFRLKDVYRTLYLSKTFARGSQTSNTTFSKSVSFPGPLLRRLTAEQLWDSLMVLRDPTIDAHEGKLTNISYRDVYASYEPLSGDELVATIKRVAADAKKAGARNTRAYTVEQSMKTEKTSPVATKNVHPNDLRASEQMIPAASRHFLYQFGQSQKEMIDAGQLDATVPQALALLNGLEQQVLSDKAGILKRLKETFKGKACVDDLFIAALARTAKPAEYSALAEILKQESAVANADVLWVLLNSHEFKFIK